MDNYQKFIHLSRYARHIPEEERRETWEETVERYVSYMYKRFSAYLTSEEWHELEDAIINLEVMPSMRALMTAGKALDRDNVAAYNCAYVAVDNQRVFDETMYILMCGTGIGFSVERQYINKLPIISEEFHSTETTINVGDSKLGWASAYRELVSLLYSGRVPQWDMSEVRESGAVLKTFGGRASGPTPLRNLFKFTIDKFKHAAGRRFSSLECHDIMCKIAQVVVVGGVRRSAMISLSNLSDDRMREAKSGNWWDFEGQRALSNNSVCYTEKPDFTSFLKEMNSLYFSRSGERGIFNRVAAKNKVKSTERRDPEHEFGCNPCSEIILRPNQFCNLTEIVVRPEDTLIELKKKVKYATILGTFQSTLTNFRYLRPIWKQNCDEERLLGVSMTGQMDNPLLNNPNSISLPSILNELKYLSIDINAELADKMGINRSTSITAVKPSGTVSQLVDCASGMHPRFSQYYIRTVRGDKKDPMSQFMIQQGISHEEDVTNASNWVFSFPKKSPENSILANTMGAMEQLKLWKIYADNWCEHKPSQTVYYTDNDFFAICQWCWENFGILSGISFLPLSDHIYEQAPYMEINEKEYSDWIELSPRDIAWEDYSELEDGTLGSQTPACSGDGCEIVDL